MFRLFGNHLRSAGSTTLKRLPIIPPEQLKALLESPDPKPLIAKPLIAKLNEIADRMSKLPGLDDLEDSHEEKAIAALTSDLKKRGYEIKGKAEPDHPIHVRYIGRQLYTQRQANLILSESERFQALDVYVAGLLMNDEGKCLARRQGIRMLEHIEGKCSIV